MGVGDDFTEEERSSGFLGLETDVTTTPAEVGHSHGEVPGDPPTTRQDRSNVLSLGLKVDYIFCPW